MDATHIPPRAARASELRRLGIAPSTEVQAQGTPALAQPPRDERRVRSIDFAGPTQRAPALASPQSIAEQAVQALDAHHLILSDDHGRMRAEPWRGMHENSGRHRRFMQTLRRAMPGLADDTALAIGRYLVDRAHAERADPRATQRGLIQGLVRQLQALQLGTSPQTCSIPDGASDCYFLRAPHYDGCLFRPGRTIDGGGQGLLMVGLTPKRHPVAIKRFVASARQQAHPVAEHLLRACHREAEMTRQAASYDVVHFFVTPRHQFIVMPLFAGSLDAHAEGFLQLHRAPSPHAPGALFGARVVLRQLLNELIYLHELHRVVHEDIKPKNIFLDVTKQAMVIGDFGLAAPMDAEGHAVRRGRTPLLAAPEQAGELSLPLTAKTDIFALAVAIINLLIDSAPQVRTYRDRLFADQRHKMLFYSQTTLQRMQAAHRDAYFAAVDGTLQDAAGLSADEQADVRHFRSIHDSIAHFDAPLGRLLLRMVNHTADARPTASEALLQLHREAPLSSRDMDAFRAAWQSHVPRFMPAAHDELVALRAIHARLQGAPAAQGAL